MKKIKRIYAVCVSEILNIKSDPVALRVPFVMPIIWLILLLPAFIIEPTNLELKIIDNVSTVESEHIVELLKENEKIILTENANNELLINNGGLLFKFNSADYLNSRVLEFEIKSSLASSASKTASFEVETTYGGKNIIDMFVILGMIGLVIQNILVFLSSVSVVKERENGTIEHLMFSPVRYSEIIMGKIIPYFIMGIIDAGILIILSYLLYGIEFTNIVPYFFVIILFVLSCLTLGLFISAITGNQMQALLYTVFLLLPSILLSGFAFPIESMPEYLQIISNFIPLTHFNIISRELVINQVGVIDVLPNILALIGIIVVSGATAIYALKGTRYKLN
ncbi:MAG: ABC transporter permease [Culicoidibacterales bacterium]